MRIAICEDTKADADALHSMLSDYFKASSEILVVVRFEDGDTLLEELLNNQIYDLIFLDIMMPGSNGIDIARSIRKLNADVLIAFITYAQEFAVDGYEVDAFAFVVKPIESDKVLNVLKKAESRLRLRKSFLILKVQGATHSIPYTDMLYIEKKNRKTYVQLINGQEIETGLTLSQLRNMLEESNLFIEPHQSFIVNMLHIRSVQHGDRIIQLSNEIMLPIARERLPNVLDAFMRYIGELA